MFRNRLRPLYSYTYERVRIYGGRPFTFEPTRCVRQECPIYPFNIVFVNVKEDALVVQDVGVKLTNREMLDDLDYADNLVWLFEWRNTPNVHYIDSSGLRLLLACASHLQNSAKLGPTQKIHKLVGWR